MELPFFLDYAEDRDIGKRDEQQDYGMFVPVEGNAEPCRNLVYVLADGIGGYSGGSVASQLAVKAFARALYENGADADIPSRMLNAVKCANKAIAFRKRMVGGELAKMGCTISCAWVNGLDLYYLSMGDSPIFLKQGARLRRINRLHNYREDSIRKARQNGMTESAIEAMLNGPEMRRCGSMITSYLDGEALRQVDLPTEPIRLNSGDCVLVASDGILTLPMKEIALLLHTDSVLDRTASRDVEAMLDRVRERDMPRQDNVSVGLIRVVLSHQPDFQKPITLNN